VRLELLTTLLATLLAALLLVLGVNAGALGLARAVGAEAAADALQGLHALLGAVELGLKLVALEALDDLLALVVHAADALVEGLKVALGGTRLKSDLLERLARGQGPLLVLQEGSLAALDLLGELGPGLDLDHAAGVLAALGEERAGENVLAKVRERAGGVAQADDVAGERLSRRRVAEIERVERQARVAGVSAALLLLAALALEVRVARRRLPVVERGLERDVLSRERLGVQAKLFLELGKRDDRAVDLDIKFLTGRNLRYWNERERSRSKRGSGRRKSEGKVGEGSGHSHGERRVSKGFWGTRRGCTESWGAPKDIFHSNTHMVLSTLWEFSAGLVGEPRRE